MAPVTAVEELKSKKVIVFRDEIMHEYILPQILPSKYGVQYTLL